MGDVVEYHESAKVYYRIYNLRARGEELALYWRRMLIQLENRGRGAMLALTGFEGPIAEVFFDQAKSTHGAVAVLCRVIGEASSVCLQFPGSGSAPYPETPQLGAPLNVGPLAANPPALRVFGTASAAYDSEAQAAGQAVNLRGVTAEMIVRRFVEAGDPPVGMWVEDPPVPVDPSMLVKLPAADRITSQVLTLSAGLAELATLTARAVESADSWDRSAGADRLALLRHIAELETSPRGREAYREHLQAFWVGQGAERAGIDLASWDPSMGAVYNQDTIIAVYEYYGALYQAHPELQWLAMGNMVGPGLASYFNELAAIREMTERRPGVPHLDALLDAIPSHDLWFYETELLTMQYLIFEDAAMMHEAYLGGGLPAIIELERAELIDPATTRAWRMIDEGSRTGEQALLSEALRLMVHREQNETIRESWNGIYARGSGPALTGLISMVGQSSIPGTRTYSEVLPRRIEAEVPLVFVATGLPGPVYVGDVEVGASMILPDGNIANADHRWRYINIELLPATNAVLADPDAVNDIINRPVRQRMAEHPSLLVDSMRLGTIPELLDRLDPTISFSRP